MRKRKDVDCLLHNACRSIFGGGTVDHSDISTFVEILLMNYQTRSTLQFASRAKLVTTNATVNEVLDESAKMKRLMKELEELRVKQKTLATDGTRCECSNYILHLSFHYS